jgi:hypothetical protein
MQHKNRGKGFIFKNPKKNKTTAMNAPQYQLPPHTQAPRKGKPCSTGGVYRVGCQGRCFKSMLFAALGQKTGGSVSSASTKAAPSRALPL